MQITMMNVNMRMPVGNLNKNAQAKSAGTGNIFGPQCKVTISREGRMLSEQNKAKSSQNIQTTQSERILLRQQEQVQANKEEYSKVMDELNSAINEARHYCGAASDQDSIEKAQDIRRTMDEMKERQSEENSRRLKEAAGAISQASKQQEEIDEKNRELYIMLKSFEEKDEEDQEGHSDRDATQKDSQESTVGEAFSQSAARIGVSAARREMQVNGMIDELYNEGHALIAQADAMMNVIQEDLDNAQEILKDNSLSEEERQRLAADYTDRAMARSQANSGEIYRMKAKGIQELKDVRELKLEHISTSPLDDMDRVQSMFMNVATDAVFHEATQGALDEDSKELADQVQEEIDKRNEIDSKPESDDNLKEDSVKEEDKATSDKTDTTPENKEETNKNEQDEESEISMMDMYPFVSDVSVRGNIVFDKEK